MIYPSLGEYLIAIIQPETTLNELKYLRPIIQPNGTPYFVYGNKSVVFKMENISDNTQYALKCYLREIPDQEKRLQSISNFFDKYITTTKWLWKNIRSSQLFYLKYYPMEFKVNTQDNGEFKFPVFLSRWEYENTLGETVKELCLKKDLSGLELLVQNFDLMASSLIRTVFAHGDLRPNNIIYCNYSELKLIDFDAAFVPSLLGLNSIEKKDLSYCHPKHNSTHFNFWLDDISLLIMSLELHFLKTNPTQFLTIENLFLSISDLSCPDESEKIKILRLSEDREVRTRLSLLEFSLMIPPNPVWGLFEILPEAEPIDESIIEGSGYDYVKYNKISFDTYYSTSLMTKKGLRKSPSFIDNLLLWGNISNNDKVDLILSENLNSMMRSEFEGEYSFLMNKFFIDYYFSAKFDTGGSIVEKRKVIFEKYFPENSCKFDGGDLFFLSEGTYWYEKIKEVETQLSYRRIYYLPFVIKSNLNYLELVKAPKWLILSRGSTYNVFDNLTNCLIGLVYEDQINDISFLKNLINLQYLDISNCWTCGYDPDLGDDVINDGISDLTPLSALCNLEYLNLSKSLFLFDLTPLYGLRNLKIIDVRGCDMLLERDWSVRELQKALPKCEILYDYIL